jgi:hypothetical protein
MATAQALRIPAVLLAATCALSCFPELPDPTVIDNLRVLAIQSDPATARLQGFPLPSVTVTALVVDPVNAELSDATHSWSLDLPEGVDASSIADLQRLLPPGPHGPTLVLDFGAGFAREDHALPALVAGVLPLRYEVETPRDRRAAVKLVYFLLPDWGDDDDSAGDDDDSSIFPWGDDDDSSTLPWGDDDDSSPAEDPWESVEAFNENPEIVSIRIGDQSFPAEGAQLPGINAALLIGDVAEAGVTLVVEVADDKDLETLDVTLFRSAGCANLKPEDSGGGGRPGGAGAGTAGSADDSPCGDASGGFGFGGGFGGGGDEDADHSLREFAWRPLPGESSAGARLFLVLRDEDGGQTWQELRPE